jgi:hypothetical protein
MRFTTSIRLLALTAVLALLVPSVVLAQSSTEGAIAGTITDPSGAILPNITVTIKSVDTGFTATQATTASGAYSFPLVSPGNYVVTVSATGFKQFSAKTVVQVGQTTSVNVKLEVGAAGTTIEVSSEAPLINVETADPSTGFDQNLVANLPNGGNDLTAVAYTAPGVTMNTGGGYGNFNVNGLPATSNVFTVDGENQMDPFLNLNNSGPTNLMLGKNSIQEATVVTDAVSGQYGQNSGAQVSYVSKGGTNQYHGNVIYEWTGSYLDANDWFNTAQSPAVARPFANNNQWAASFGGPIKKDKTFFFIDTEGIRYIVPETQTVFTPTTSFLNDIYNNLTGASGYPGPVANGYAAPSAATIATYQTAANIWQAAPGFNTGTPISPALGSCTDAFTGATPVGLSAATLAAGCIQSYQASPALPAKEWLLIGRFDQNFGSKDRAFFRFDIDTGTQATYADPIDPSKFSAASYQPEYNNDLTWNHAFSGTATNQFVAAASYYRAVFDELTNGATSPFPWTLDLIAGVPVTGLNADNDAFPQGRDVTQYQFIDDFAKTIGKHSLKFGANFRRYDITNYDQSELVTPFLESGLTDYFNGSSSFFLQNAPLRQSAPMNTGGIGIYAEDDWAVTSRLKLTLALRGEHNFNPTCDINCFTMPVAGFATIAAQGAGTPYNQALNINRRDAFNSVQAVNLSPRVGFIWSPRDNSKTVVSGAFSLLYDAFPAFITDSFVNAPYLIGVQQLGPDFDNPTTTYPTVAWGDTALGAENVTRTTASTIRNGSGSTPSLANGLTVGGLEAAGGAPFSITGFPGKLITPQVQEWNLSVQQSLDSKSKVTLMYTGNHGIHEAYPNATLNGTSSEVYGFNATTPDTRFGSYTEWYSGAVSNYNGLTASYSRRMTAGFVMNASYTWAHALDEISNGGLLPYGARGNIQGQLNPLSFRSNYGNADYDIRNTFNANYVWTDPYHFGNRFANLLFGNWLFSENFIVRSGMPFSITDGTAVVGNVPNGFNVLAQPTGPAQQSCTNGFSACFNSANIESASGLPYYPTQMRNQYRGPGFFTSDFSFGKDFHLGERVKFNIGANIYNIFNHPNFQNPVSSWTSPTCSTISAAYTQPGCGQVVGQAAPPTGAYGSFAQGLPAGREGQLQGRIIF